MLFFQHAGFVIVRLRQDDAHSRIIWGVSWSHDDALFATASREKQKSVKFWAGRPSNTTEESGGDMLLELEPQDVECLGEDDYRQRGRRP